MKAASRKDDNQFARGRQDLRKIFHIAVGMYGFLYPFMDWETILFSWVAAMFCAWFISSRVDAFESLLKLLERRLGYSPAMVGFALMMVIASLIFRDQMKDSALILLSALAFGDGFSALIGMSYPSTRISYNRKKSIGGSLAFIFFGTIGALFMLFFLFSFMMHKTTPIEVSTFPVFRVLIVMTICAIVETIPWRIPDNIPIGIAGIIALLATMKLYR